MMSDGTSDQGRTGDQRRTGDQGWAGKVSADMERIFGRDDLASPSARERDHGDRSRGFVIHAPAEERTGSSRFVRVLTIAVPMLAIVAAIFFFIQIVPEMRPAAAVAQARPVRAAAPVRPAPVAFQASATPEAEAVADPGDDPPAPSPTVQVRRARAGRPAVIRPTPVSVRDDGCRPGSEDNACIYRDVRAADRRLVAAYRDAAEAGVPRGEMVAIRREWTRALADSLDDPDGTIRIYDELARRLRDASARTAGRRA